VVGMAVHLVVDVFVVLLTGVTNYMLTFMYIASRLGRRPKRLKEMQLAAAAAAVGVASTDQQAETRTRRLCMSLDVADVNAELQVTP